MNGAEENRKIRMLKELSGFMGRKLSDDQLRFYQNNLREVPAEFLASICGNYMMENPPGVPSRFPTVFDLKKHWNAVRSTQQNRASDFRRSPCSDCRGEGILWYRVKDDRSISGIYERCCKCNSCNNHLQHGPLPRLQFMTKRDLEERGLETYPYSRRSGPKKIDPMIEWQDGEVKGLNEVLPDMDETIRRRNR